MNQVGDKPSIFLSLINKKTILKAFLCLDFVPDEFKSYPRVKNLAVDQLQTDKLLDPQVGLSSFSRPLRFFNMTGDSNDTY